MTLWYDTCLVVLEGAVRAAHRPDDGVHAVQPQLAPEMTDIRPFIDLHRLGQQGASRLGEGLT